VILITWDALEVCNLELINTSVIMASIIQTITIIPNIWIQRGDAWLLRAQTNNTRDPLLPLDIKMQLLKKLWT
jgi:hypothetical protein